MSCRPVDCQLGDASLLRFGPRGITLQYQALLLNIDHLLLSLLL